MLYSMEYQLFEINPCFSATCPIRSMAGINEPRIVLRNQILGEDIKVSNYEKLICMRYWNEVYIQHYSYEKASRASAVDSNDWFIQNYF
jgi:carbamoyl-phosphate synthase large subunit